MNMTLAQLRYILAVDQMRSFQAAAEACCVTQPTLSMQIQKLEEHFGITLFDRSSHPVEPTPLGKRVLEQARTILYEADKIPSIIQSDTEEVQGPLRLGVIPTLAPYLLPEFVPEFCRHYQQVELFVEEMQTERVIEGLKNGSLDAGLVATPLDASHIKQEPIFYEPFLLYVSPTHPLREKRAVTEDELNVEEAFLLTEGHCFRNQAIRLCRRRAERITSMSNKIRFESGSLETLKKLVDHTYGYTLLPKLAARDLVRSRKEHSRLVPFVAPEPTREISLISHRYFPGAAILRALHSRLTADLPAQLKQSPNATTVIPVS